MVRRGFFLALEGIDGAGTTSQLAPVAAHLRALGHRVAVTCEPSTQPPGALLRRLLRGVDGVDEAAMALLFAADRLLHLRHEVLPRLHEGAVVLCDRYLWSSYAYQTTASPALALDWVEAINGHARGPDLTFWLDVPPAVAKLRRTARGGPVEIFDHDGRQQRVAVAYAELFSRHLAANPATDQASAVRIDAAPDQATVSGAICSEIDRRLARLPDGTLGPAVTGGFASQ